LAPNAGRPSLGAKLVPPRVKGIRRERLEHKLAGVWDHRLGLVVGPAGSGKTTLLTQFAAGCGAPVAWYRADGHDTSSAALLRYLGQALSGALEGLVGEWDCLEQAVDELARRPAGPALLVVDDVHLLEGSPAESTLARLFDDAPLSLSFLVAGRRPPAVNLSRRRLSGALVEVHADDLRFRSWEVEHLFRDFYGEILPPEDLAALARRTEGWAAGLQLFHLATAGKPPRERRRFLHQLVAGSRLVREYLACNVLDELPPQTSAFLLATSVLGQLSGPLCDRFLGVTGTGDILAELEREQIFTFAVDDAGTYRYHEVFRSHLEAVLVQRLGEEEARRRYQRAGALLDEAGAVGDAIRAYARAGDDDSVARLLGDRGEEVLDGSQTWLEGLPPALVDHDPWLRVVGARRALAAGQWHLALDGYREAERLFGPGAAAESCRVERLALAVWLEPVHVGPVGCSSVVRAATHRDPLGAGRQAVRLGAPCGPLAAGLASLLAGHTRDACASFDAVLAGDDPPPLVALGARLASGVAHVLSGRASRAPAFEELAFEAERLGAHWLARLARGLVALSAERGGAREAAAFGEFCEANGDAWGVALAAFLEGVADLRAGVPAAKALEQAAGGFHALGAEVLETWARALLALGEAAGGEPGWRLTALAAESMASALGVPGAAAVALHALAADEQAAALAADCGLALAALGPTGHPVLRDREPTVVPPRSPPSPVHIRCLGGFTITIGGAVLDCASVKPRARTCLRLLVMHLGAAVHRETLVECLWPGIDAQAGRRNLHVVISTLRQLLEPGVARGGSSMITREGDTYRLRLPAGSWCDLTSFEAAIAQCRAARSTGDQDGETRASRTALDLYVGDLLPDAGPAEWVVAERERCRMDAADAAQRLAEIELAQGRPADAAATCDRGLRIDRHRDGLWRLRIDAAEKAGDLAGAADARHAYEAVLAELGLLGATS
jgi:DNA-binding SARP family transcriptional activator